MRISIVFFIGMLILSLFFSITDVCAAEFNARRIMEQVENRDDGNSVTYKIKMVLIDKNGYKRVRHIQRFRKYKGRDKMIILFFLSPADVKDSAFLIYDYSNYEIDDDQWLYLPALYKTKRIAASDKSGSFMGSDFNYSDMTRKNLDAYNFRVIKEKNVRGEKTWIIEALPKSKNEMKETGYSKSVLFVRQDNFVVVRAVYWVLNSKKLKYLDVKKLKQIDGIWTEQEKVMTTRKGKHILHKTILKFDDVQYNQNLKEDMFSLRSLKKGF